MAMKISPIPWDTMVPVKEENKYIASQLMPLVVRPPSGGIPDYALLFYTHQTLTDENRYFNWIFTLDPYDPVEQRWLSNDWFSLRKMKENEENHQLLQQYVEDLTESNLYTTNFEFEKNEEKDIYIAKSIRKEQNEYRSSEIHVFRNNYIRLKLFFEDFLTRHAFDQAFFYDKSFDNMTFVPIQDLMIDAVATRSNLYAVHYTMIGPNHKMFKANWTCYIPKHKVRNRNPKQPLMDKLYEARYNRDFNIRRVVYDENEDLAYLLYRKDEKLYALILDKTLYTQTNFLDSTNAIFYNITTTRRTI